MPTAGTDYPCLADLPGRERFYTRLDDPLAFSPRLDAVRRGRTFITNGPALGFSIDGSFPGDEIAPPKPGAVQVRARVRFDPSRNRVDRLEIVQAGRAVAAATQTMAGEITLDASVPISESTWLAFSSSTPPLGAAVDQRRNRITTTATVSHLFTSHISNTSDVKDPIIISANAHRNSKGFVKISRSWSVLQTCRNISTARRSYRVYGVDE